MAVPPYVTAGTVIEEAWGDQIAASVVNPFASSAARSAAITSPTSGMVTAVTAADTTNGLEVYNGTSWRRPWNMAWGYIGASIVTSSTVATNANITTYSLSAIARRRYRITAGVGSVSVSAGPTIVALAVYVAGAKVAGCNAYCPDLNIGYMGATTVGYYAPTSTGTVTIAAYGELASGSATITWGASATSPIQLYVEDIGPSGAPA